MTLIFSDNAKSTLAGPIVGTQLALAAGSGGLFPNPGNNQSFKLSLFDAATGNVKEIVEISSRNGDLCTISQRAQEGTAQQVWQAGDLVSHGMTAGTADSFLQKANYQGPGAIVWHYALDTSGVANVISCPNAADTIGPLGGLLTAASVTNTGAVVINDGSGSCPLLRQNGQPLIKGDILANAPFGCVKDASGNYRLIGFAQNEVQRIVINPLIGVDPNNGNDASGDTSHSFKTCSAAIAYASSQLFSPSGITLQLLVPNAVYDCPHYISYLSGKLTIVGDENNPQLYTMTSDPNATDGCIISGTGALELRGFTLNNISQNGCSSLISVGSCQIDMYHMSFQCIQGTSGAAMQVNPGAHIGINNCSFQGNYGTWLFANGGNAGMGNLPNAQNVYKTVSFIGNPTIGILFNVAPHGAISVLPYFNFNGSIQCNQQWYVGPLGYLAGVISGGGNNGTTARPAGYIPGSNTNNYKDALGYVS